MQKYQETNCEIYLFSIIWSFLIQLNESIDVESFSQCMVSSDMSILEI